MEGNQGDLDTKHQHKSLWPHLMTFKTESANVGIYYQPRQNLVAKRMWIVECF